MFKTRRFSLSLLLLSTVLSLWASYSPRVQASGAQTKADLKQFAALYAGEFDNYQEITDVRASAHPPIHLSIQRVNAPALGAYVFLLRAERMAKPFVRRLDSFQLNATQQIEMSSYGFASAEQAVAVEHDLGTLANMKPEQLRLLTTCPAIWQRAGTQFSGLCAANGEQPNALASLGLDELHLPEHADAGIGGHFRRCVVYDGEVTHISETGKRQKPFAITIHNQGQTVPLAGSNFVLQMTEDKDEEGQPAVKVGLWENGKELVSALAKASQMRFRFITEVVEVRLTKQKRD